MKFSIIVPVYNTAAYLTDCLSSIAEQSFSDFEVICIDDGSTDGSKNILQQFADNEKRFSYIEQLHAGTGAARNLAMKNAKGDYYVFFDSDDLFSPYALEIINFYLQKANDDILIFNISENIESVMNGICLKRIEKDKERFYKNIDNKKCIIYSGTGINRVIKADFAKQHNICFAEGLHYEDVPFSIDSSAQASSIGHVDAPPLYYHRHRPESDSHRIDIEVLRDIFKVFDKVLKTADENNYLKDYSRELEWLAISHVMYWTLTKAFRCKYDKKLIKDCLNYMKQKFPDYKNNSYIDECYGLNKKNLDYILKEKFWSLYFRGRIFDSGKIGSRLYEKISNL